MKIIRQKERCFSTVAPVVPTAAERTVKMSSFIFDGSLIATAFAFSFFFVCLRFLCYFLFLKKVGSPSPINPNLKINHKKRLCKSIAVLNYFSSGIFTEMQSSSSALGSPGAGHLDISSDAFCTLGNAITSRISSRPRRRVTSLSRPNARPP